MSDDYTREYDREQRRSQANELIRMAHLRGYTLELGDGYIALLYNNRIKAQFSTIEQTINYLKNI